MGLEIMIGIHGDIIFITGLKRLEIEYCRFLMSYVSNLQESSQLHTNLPLSLFHHLKALLLIIHEGIFNLLGMSFHLSLPDFREKA